MKLFGHTTDLRKVAGENILKSLQRSRNSEGPISVLNITMIRGTKKGILPQILLYFECHTTF